MTQTNKDEPLLACPLCSDPMRIVAGDTLQHVNQGDCLIGALAWQASPSFLTRWNRRPAPATIPAFEGEVEPIGQIIVEPNGEWLLKGWATNLKPGLHHIYAHHPATNAIRALEGEVEPLNYSRMGSGGRCNWLALREAVSEAKRGSRKHIDPIPDNIYTGHAPVSGINYNSLDRIVTAFVDEALAHPPATDAIRAAAFEEAARWLRGNIVGGISASVIMLDALSTARHSPADDGRVAEPWALLREQHEAMAEIMMRRRQSRDQEEREKVSAAIDTWRKVAAALTKPAPQPDTGGEEGK